MSMEIIQDRVTKNATFWNFEGKVDFVDEWFLMRTPIPICLILIGYWAFVLKIGPKYMNLKPAYNLQKLLAIYNIAQIGLSCYLVYIGVAVLSEFGLITTSCHMDDKDERLIITTSGYIYFFAKLTELLDTIFFVLRKNFRQITFLHVYHHSIMLMSTWTALKYEPSYNSVFIGTINSFVHVIMYTYYYLSAFPELSKYLWWKKYITKMQITQFILIILQIVASYFFSGCPPSYTLLAFIVCNAFLFTGLFLNFYFNSYKKKVN